MLKVLCELKGVTPVTFNKKLRSEKGPNESYDEFEDRIWRERCDCNDKDEIVLRAARFKKSICLGAQWLNMQIPGEGKATYTKHFKGGVIVMNSILLGVERKDVRFADEPDGIYTAPRKGQGKRWIHFPIIEKWKGELQINILDEKITENVFQRVIDYAGMAVGIGSWRPENAGENGRYECGDIVFEKV